MSFEKNFCPSPWFHMGIDQSGKYMPCRWGIKIKDNSEPLIDEVDIDQYFQTNLANIRKEMLNGNSPAMCQDCNKMDKHGKVSGRLQQRLKVGILQENFEKSLCSSQWFKIFKESVADGTISLLPVDWQIDLGNFCNSGCIFCSPASSSSLASEWKKIGLIKNTPTNSWCTNSDLLHKFLQTIRNSKNLRYLHFIGGETLITPAFKRILKELIKANHTSVVIGFTTNLTVWDAEVIELLSKFKSVHAGLSIETLTSLNDYVRWPSKIGQVRELLDKWIHVSKNLGWLAQIRTTPTIFTVSFLDDIFEYAWENNLPVESCNFLDNPEYLRPSLLPQPFRQVAIEKLKKWIKKHDQNINTSNKIVNNRHPDTVKSYLIQDANSYITYLENEDYETDRLPDLVNYLKLIERNRNNSILDYVPEYEELLRPAGY